MQSPPKASVRTAVDEIVDLAPAALAERLAALSNRLQLAYSKNTVRAWRANWRVWTSFTDEIGEPALPTSVEILERFLMAQVHAGKKRATLEQYLATLATVHRLAELPNPIDTLEGGLMWRGIKRNHLVRAQRQAQGLSWADLETIVGAMEPGAPATIRDTALVRVAFETLFRRSEIAAMDVHHVEFGRDGSALVILPRSKTDQEGEGDLRPLSPRTGMALRAWLDASGITEGAVWRSLPPTFKGTASLRNRLGDGDIARIYKRRATRAGFVSEAISAHSTRVGAAQELLENNYPAAAIMVAGGWKTERMVVRYGKKLAASRNAMAQLQRKRST
jgi:integrase